MSSRNARKASNPRAKAPEPIITRTKSAQQRQQKNKEQKSEKPKLTKPEIKSPKLKKNVIYSKQSLLKPLVNESDEVIEQVEYYPNKLKRDICAKKIQLKPKHNFKVIAATNKRKLGTPQKGMKSPSTKHSSPKNLSKSPKRSKISTRPCSSPELSVQDMVRLMEETRSLSDEDFMEILTCPSPVWWEDPPDGGFDEDSIHTRSPDPPPDKSILETNKRKITTNTTINKPNNNNKITTEQKTEQTLNITKPKAIENKKDEKFAKKKLKLENILGNIKNKSVPPKNEVPIERNRKLSESEGDISDLSFNEEEILKNLENMDIPIEQSPIETNEPLDTKIEKEIKQEKIETYENEIVSKNDNVDRETIDIKPEIKDDILLKSSVFDNSIPESSEIKNDVILETNNSNIDKKPDEMVVYSCTKTSLVSNKDSNTLDVDISSNSENGIKIPKENLSKSVKKPSNSNMANKNDVAKKAKDLSEFITVYKIIPEKIIIENNSENEPKTIEIAKLDSVRGKLNDFFKHCKNNVRVKKNENPIPEIPLTDVKKEPTDNEIENGDNKIDLVDENNRLNSCDLCIVKTENGTTDFSCDKCEKAPILPCGLCNFVADTKEVYRKHVSSCKDVARISWKHNYVMNQT